MMDSNVNNNPAIVGAMDRIMKSMSLRFACITIVTNVLVESNLAEPVNIASTRRLLDRALLPDVHVGRTDAGPILRGLVRAGLVSVADERLILGAAKLLSEDPNLKIDPLLEVTRRVLGLSLIAGGRRG